MLDHIMKTAAHNALRQFEVLDKVAQNVANVNTTGYKTHRFEQFLATDGRLDGGEIGRVNGAGRDAGALEDGGDDADDAARQEAQRIALQRIEELVEKIKQAEAKQAPQEAPMKQSNAVRPLQAWVVVNKNGHQFAEKVRRIVESTEFTFEDTRIPVTISMGVATLDPETADSAALIKRADDRLTADESIAEVPLEDAGQPADVTQVGDGLAAAFEREPAAARRKCEQVHPVLDDEHRDVPDRQLAQRVQFPSPVQNAAPLYPTPPQPSLTREGSFAVNPPGRRKPGRHRR